MDLEHWQPAYPCRLLDEETGIVTPYSGVTLLDYFASQAMAGLLSQNCEQENDLGNLQSQPGFGPFGSVSENSLARTAYTIAKAMVDARQELFVKQTAIE